MRVMVTGARGWLGAHLVRALLARGHQVVAMVRSLPDGAGAPDPAHPGCRSIAADLAGELPAGCMDGVDAVIHAAALVHRRPEVPDDFVRDNITATANVLQAACRAGVPRFVYVSTGSVFGRPPREKVLTGLSLPEPTSLYGLTKYAGERLAEILPAGSGTGSAVVRFPALFGPGVQGGIVPLFARSALAGEPIEVLGQGRNLRSLVHVADAVDVLAALAALKDGPGFASYMAGSRDSASVAEVARLLRDGLASRSPIVFVDRVVPFDYDVVIDNTPLAEAVGYRPMSVAEGLSSYLRELR